MPTSTDACRKRMHASCANERTRCNLERSSIKHTVDTAQDHNTGHEDDNSEDIERVAIDVGGSDSKTDGQKGNLGSSKCHQWTVRGKLDFVDEVM
jgi:hypothetical protein